MMLKMKLNGFLKMLNLILVLFMFLWTDLFFKIHADKSIETISLLDQEINTIQSIIHLYKKKKNLLLSSFNVSMPNTTNLFNAPQTINEKIETPTEVRFSEFAPKFEDEYVEKLRIQLTEDTVISKLVSIETRPGLSNRRKSNKYQFRHLLYRNIVIACTLKGIIRIYNVMDGILLCEYHTNRNNVISFEFDDKGTRRLPYLIVYYEDGSSILLSIRLTENQMVAAGKFFRNRWNKKNKIFMCMKGRQATTTLYDILLSNEINYYVAPENNVNGYYQILYENIITSNISGSTFKKENQPIIRIHPLFQKIYILFGNKYGDLHIYSDNGTCLFKNKLNHSIKDIKSFSSDIIAYTAGKDIGFYSPTRNYFYPLHVKRCHGSIDTIEKINIDPERRRFLYLTTSTGKVLLVEIHFNDWDDSRPSENCRIMKQISFIDSTINNSKRNIFITNIGNRVFVLNNNELHVYEFNSIQSNEDKVLKYLFSFNLSDNYSYNWRYFDGNDVIIYNGLLSIYGVNKLNNNKKENIIYLSLIINEDADYYDLSWLRPPIMIFGVFIVFGWKQFHKIKGKNKNNYMSNNGWNDFAYDFNKWDKARGGTGIDPSYLHYKNKI